jgi:hypothetical protein
MANVCLLPLQADADGRGVCPVEYGTLAIWAMGDRSQFRPCLG